VGVERVEATPLLSSLMAREGSAMSGEGAGGGILATMKQGGYNALQAVDVVALSLPMGEIPTHDTAVQC
jgi:hypothetical protein